MDQNKNFGLGICVFHMKNAEIFSTAFSMK